jgi:hypothetical protein
MDPFSAVLLIILVGGAGAIYAHARKKKMAREYGEVSLFTMRPESSSLQGAQIHPSGVCSADKRKHTAIGDVKPFTGMSPRRGTASNLIFQWDYVISPGDDPGRIAEGITGDRRRFVELLSANADKRMKSYGKEVNFADPADFCVGGHLYLPKTWNPWIDEEGNLRGNVIPFPPYDKLPSYPAVDPSMITAGFIANATGWMALPTVPVKLITEKTEGTKLP